jgi:hypothetical protein
MTSTQPRQAIRARLIHQRHPRMARQRCPHPRRGIENQRVVAMVAAERPPLHTGHSQQEQRHSQKLQKQRHWLLNPAPPCDRRRPSRHHPEPQSGNHLFPARPIQQIKRDGKNGNGAENRQELEQREIQKFHG